MKDINWLKAYNYSDVKGRYVTVEMLAPFIAKLGTDFTIVEEGKSVENRAIKSITWGEGKCKVFMWSQMHGNESTTTKAVVDLLHILQTCKEPWVENWKQHFTFLIVPILNPDGANAYTRANANQVDLNRDSVELTQPESKLLRMMFERFAPDFAFNLHDQRTIFGAGDTGNPATISFLAPSYNEACEWNATRMQAMQIIVSMYKEVNKVIPDHIGRFDDAFNINCIGDYFQAQGVPTILFEAGHYPEDYQREKTRDIVLLSLFKALEAIYTKNYESNKLKEYLSIYENQKNFNDVLLENVFFAKDSNNYMLNIQYLEVLEKENIIFSPRIVGIAEKESKFAHNAIKKQLKFSKHIESLEKCIGENMYDAIDFFNLE